jgi:hypothetical protein
MKIQPSLANYKTLTFSAFFSALKKAGGITSRELGVATGLPEHRITETLSHGLNGSMGGKPRLEVEQFCQIIAVFKSSAKLADAVALLEQSRKVGRTKLPPALPENSLENIFNCFIDSYMLAYKNASAKTKLQQPSGSVIRARVAALTNGVLKRE